MTNDDWRAAMAQLEAENAKLRIALVAAEEHLSFCNYGDSYEHECAMQQKLPEKIQDALKTTHSPDR